MKKLLLILLSFFSFGEFLFSDEKSELEGLNPTYGLYFNYNFNIYNVNFRQLPGVPSCCPKFETGTGNGLAAGALYELSLPYNLNIGLRAGFNILNGTLQQTEPTLVKVDTNIVNGKFEHVLKATIYNISAEPILSWNFYDNFSFHFGAHLGYTILSTFKQYESILEPADRGVFVDSRSRVRNDTSGDIPDINKIYSALMLGVSARFPLNNQNTLFICPEIFYNIGLNDVVNGINWKINSLRFGASFRWIPKKTYIKDTIIPEEKIYRFILDTILVEKENIEKSYVTLGKPFRDLKIDSFPNKIVITEIIKRTDTLNKRPNPKVNMAFNTPIISISSQFISEAYPILPIVFFDNNSAELQPYYKRIDSRKNYATNLLPNEPLKYHENILNIIGERMLLNPHTKITLKGFSDSSTEDGDCDLAKNRCETVKSYLVGSWNIEPERINIAPLKSPCVPKLVTHTRNDSGYAENRRVEILSDNDELLSPIYKKHIGKSSTFSPPLVKIDPSGSSTQFIKSWEINATQEGIPIFNLRGNGKPIPTEHLFSDENALRLKSNSPLDITMSITDIDGNTSTQTKSINIVNDTSDSETERLSLILFKVSSDAIPEQNKRILKQFIKDVTPQSSIMVKGYSDILGDDDKNRSLAERRAKKTAEIILNSKPEIQSVDIIGYGSLEYPRGISSYSTPPERFLSRTVQIEIQKNKK